MYEGFDDDFEISTEMRRGSAVDIATVWRSLLRLAMEPGLCQRSYRSHISLYFCPEWLRLFSFRCFIDIHIRYGRVLYWATAPLVLS